MAGTPRKDTLSPDNSSGASSADGSAALQKSPDRIPVKSKSLNTPATFSSFLIEAGKLFVQERADRLVSASDVERLLGDDCTVTPHDPADFSVWDPRASYVDNVATQPSSSCRFGSTALLTPQNFPSAGFNQGQNWRGAHQADGSYAQNTNASSQPIQNNLWSGGHTHYDLGPSYGHPRSSQSFMPDFSSSLSQVGYTGACNEPLPSQPSAEALAHSRVRRRIDFCDSSSDQVTTGLGPSCIHPCASQSFMPDFSSSLSRVGYTDCAYNITLPSQSSAAAPMQPRTRRRIEVCDSSNQVATQVTTYRLQGNSESVSSTTNESSTGGVFFRWNPLSNTFTEAQLPLKLNAASAEKWGRIRDHYKSCSDEAGSHRFRHASAVHRLILRSMTLEHRIGPLKEYALSWGVTLVVDSAENLASAGFLCRAYKDDTEYQLIGRSTLYAEKTAGEIECYLGFLSRVLSMLVKTFREMAGKYCPISEAPQKCWEVSALLLEGFRSGDEDKLVAAEKQAQKIVGELFPATGRYPSPPLVLKNCQYVESVSERSLRLAYGLVAPERDNQVAVPCDLRTRNRDELPKDKPGEVIIISDSASDLDVGSEVEAPHDPADPELSAFDGHAVPEAVPESLESLEVEIDPDRVDQFEQVLPAAELQALLDNPENLVNLNVEGPWRQYGPKSYLLIKGSHDPSPLTFEWGVPESLKKRFPSKLDDEHATKCRKDQYRYNLSLKNLREQIAELGHDPKRHGLMANKYSKNRYLQFATASLELNRLCRELERVAKLVQKYALTWGIIPVTEPSSTAEYSLLFKESLHSSKITLVAGIDYARAIMVVVNGGLGLFGSFLHRLRGALVDLSSKSCPISEDPRQLVRELNELFFNGLASGSEAKLVEAETQARAMIADLPAATSQCPASPVFQQSCQSCLKLFEEMWAGGATCSSRGSEGSLVANSGQGETAFASTSGKHPYDPGLFRQRRVEVQRVETETATDATGLSLSK